MNPYNTAILESEFVSSPMTTPTEKLVVGTGISIESFYWFNAYKSSDFPQVTCDKEYFFIYSTDHSSTGGAVWWGKGNNLDLTDFVEVAAIFSGYQIETPRLILNTEVSDSEVLHLFCHTDVSDPSNDGKQQTHLFTSSGGSELHSMTWTDMGTVLGITGDENHTGYFYPYIKNANKFIGTHIGKGGLPQPWKTSTSLDLRVWNRVEEVDVITNIETNYFAQLSDGLFFDIFGQKWWIGQLHPQSGTTWKLGLCKSNSDLNYIEQVAILYSNSPDTRYSVYQDGDTAHIYQTKPKTKLFHSTYDLNNLKNYL